MISVLEERRHLACCEWHGFPWIVLEAGLINYDKFYASLASLQSNFLAHRLTRCRPRALSILQPRGPHSALHRHVVSHILTSFSPFFNIQDTYPNFGEGSLPSQEDSHFLASRFLGTSCFSSARLPFITVFLIKEHSTRYNLEVSPKFRLVPSISVPIRDRLYLPGTSRSCDLSPLFSIRPFGR